MEQAFRAILHNAASVTALAPAARINCGTHPQGADFPAAVINVIDDAAGLTLAGTDGLSQGRVQVDCYGMTYGAAKGLALAVRAVLHSYRGGSFRLIEHTGTRDGRETGTNEAERPFRVSLDFMTHWRAT